MESSFYNLSDTLVQFIVLSFFFALGIGILFILIKVISQAAPSPYTFKAFGMICIPGFLYCFLESFSERQAWNFFAVLFYLSFIALVQLLLIRRISIKIYLVLGCMLALVLWMTIPKGMMKMF